MKKTDSRAMLALVGGAFFLLAYEYYGSTSFFRTNLYGLFPVRGRFVPIFPYIYWYTSTLLLLALIPLLSWKLMTGRPISGLGLSLGNWKQGLIISAISIMVMLPIVTAAAQLPSFQHKYPLCSNAGSGPLEFLIYESAYMGYFFAWEFFFRGFMLFSLEEAIGGTYAVLVQTVPFALLHVGKPQPEAFASIIAGVALGILALRTRSVLYCALIHGMVALSMDIAALFAAGRLHHLMF
ncbi:MAG: CPBP family intramembrane metalloprotease [Deltaproteobacteria bacterium]|nr:CPBP family intramembrane metalloprotease [Deltaproteobacteria bacterium]